MTLPAGQPEDPASSHAPTVAETTTTSYDIFDQPEEVREVFRRKSASGVLVATTRTKLMTYDSAGRLVKSETTTSDPEEERAVAPVTYGYSEATGAQTSEESEGHKSESTYNTLGELVEYKDSAGNVAHYSYEEPDGLLKEMTDSSPHSQGLKSTYERFSYDPLAKQLVALEDSAAGTFTATYNGAGQLVSEGYPNAMCANYAYNSLGEASHIEYVKSGSCSEAGAKVWFSESVHSSIHGNPRGRRLHHPPLRLQRRRRPHLPGYPQAQEHRPMRRAGRRRRSPAPLLRRSKPPDRRRRPIRRPGQHHHAAGRRCRWPGADQHLLRGQPDSKPEPAGKAGRRAR